jgi:hypothetical protein
MWRSTCGFLLLAACQSRSPGVSVSPGVSTSPTPSAVSKNVAVVELFTSEGCSSCPAADENLARITDEAATRGEPLITLELHVDYWNYLGWTDPFSAAAYSERQRRYVQRFPAGGSYTPQLVVNGREELVGSNAQASRAAIARALQTPAQVAITLRAVREASQIRLDYEAGNQRPVELVLVVAQDAARTDVPRGENARRRLEHRHAARALRELHLATSGKGSWTTPWPHDGAAFVAAFATDPETLAVLGGASQQL